MRGTLRNNFRLYSTNAINVILGSGKVTLSSISPDFNEVVCIDHFIPSNIDVLSIMNGMDSRTRYSAGLTVPSTSRNDAVYGFELQRISEFWPSFEVQGYKAFENAAFTENLHQYDVRFRPIPPRRHSKNVLESKHRILRDIYIRLKSENSTVNPRLLVAKMFRDPNEPYGNILDSAHELAKVYKRPVNNDFPSFLPHAIRKAQDELSAKRKLNLILSSISIIEPRIKVSDNL